MSQDYTVAKELASLKEIKQSAEQRISDLSLNALNYVNDHRLHKAGGGSEDAWPYFDVVVNLSTADQTGVYLKGSYETIKTAFDAYDVTFSMCGVRPKIEGEEPARISGMAPSGDIEEDGSFTFIPSSDNTSIWHFHQDGTITYSRGGTSQ